MRTVVTVVMALALLLGFSARWVLAGDATCCQQFLKCRQFSNDENGSFTEDDCTHPRDQFVGQAYGGECNPQTGLCEGGQAVGEACAANDSCQAGLQCEGEATNGVAGCELEDVLDEVLSSPLECRCVEREPRLFRLRLEPVLGPVFGILRELQLVPPRRVPPPGGDGGGNPPNDAPPQD